MSEQNSSAGWVVSGVLAIAILAGVVYVRRHAPGEPAKLAATVPVVAGTAPTAPTIRHPIADVARNVSVESPLPPALQASDGSDDSVRAALATLAGGQSLQGMLVPEFLIQRIVATIDALPHRQLGPNVLPLRRPPGSLVTRSQDGITVIDPGNAMRYAPYMRVLEGVDADQLVAWYVRNYAVFQRAYRQLGYPDAYFNDRLIAVIDHLLATPEPTTAPPLVRPKVLYEFAAPALESLSAGQKMLLRAGPQGERQIKDKLRAIRAALTGIQPAATGKSADRNTSAPGRSASVRPGNSPLTELGQATD